MVHPIPLLALTCIVLTCSQILTGSEVIADHTVQMSLFLHIKNENYFLKIVLMIFT